MTLTAERAREVLAYDPSTGQLTWKANTGKKRLVGHPAGYLASTGQLYVRIDRKMHLAHRVMWLIVHGRMPAADIDHINGDPGDNRLCNLREATRTQNMANKKMHKNNTSGYKGVQWCRQRNMWKTNIRKNRRLYHIGFFETPEAAAHAYLAKARELFGEFATDRR